MKLIIPGNVGNFYHLQMDLTPAKHARCATAYISKDIHRDVQFWKSLCADMGSRPTFFAEIVQHLATNVGYSNALGLGCRGVWIDPNEDDVH